MFDKKTIFAFFLGGLSVGATVGLTFWATRPSGYSYDYSVPDYIDTYTPGYFSSYGGFGDVGRLIDRAPMETRKLLSQVFRQLVEQPNDRLYILKNDLDPCTATEMIDCRGLESQLVRPFIDAALDHRKSVESLHEFTWTIRAAVASCLISFFALVISFLQFRRHKR